MDDVTIVPAKNLEPTQTLQTSGMSRLEAQLKDDLHVAEIRTEPGTVSGWHHHGDHATYGYVVSGMLRFEFGPAGGEVAEAGPGDFFYVPPQTIHRESNPGSETQILVGFRLGSGPTVFNVEGPG